MKTTRIRVPVLLALSLAAAGGLGPLATASACPNSAANLVILLGPHMLTVGPDLCDGGVEYGFDPQTVSTGEQIHILGRIKNTGTVTVSANTFRVGWYASADTTIDPAVDYQIGDLGTFPKAIEPGSFYRFDVQRLVNVPPGTYYVGWIIDCTNAVAETNESNNTVCIKTPRLTVHAAEVIVPNVVGKDEESAIGAIKVAALVVGVTTRRCSDTVAVGNVISQSPAAGTKVMSGSGVSLVISTGPCQVETQAATDITCSSATLNGKVVADGGAVCQYRFRYKRWDSPTYSETSPTGSKRTGETFSQAITGLTPRTQYRFAARVSNGTCESDWGTELRFTTPTSPTVTAGAATNITAHGATLHGTLVDDGGQTCQYQLRYKTRNGSYTESKWTGSLGGWNVHFSMTLSKLNPGTRYYFSFRARNDSCEGAWSDELSFVTLAVTKPTAAMVDVTNVLERSATFAGNIVDDGNEPCQYRFRYTWRPLLRIMQGVTPETYTSWTGAKKDGESFSEDITTLGPNTPYTVTVQARNSAGEGPWSTPVSFTTLAIPVITDIRSIHFSPITRDWLHPSRHAYYLDGVPLTEQITVAVDWHGATPGKIEWKTPKGTYETLATEVSRSFNMGSDFGAGGKLVVKAVPSDAPGARESAPVTANFTVIPPPPGIPTNLLSQDPLTVAQSVNKYVGQFTASLLNESDPLAEIWITSEAQIQVIVMDGCAQYRPLFPFPLLKIHAAGEQINWLLWTFRCESFYTDGQWQTEGYLESSLLPGDPETSYKREWELLSLDIPIPVGPVPVAVSVDVTESLSSYIVGDIVGWPQGQSPTLAGGMRVFHATEGTATATVVGLFGNGTSIRVADRWCKHLPGGQINTCVRLQIEPVFCIFGCFDISTPSIWIPDSGPCCTPSTLTAQSVGPAALTTRANEFRLMARDDLGSDYARWLSLNPAGNSQGRNLTILSAADGAPGEAGGEQVLQTNVFSESRPSITADGDQLFLAWVCDDPNRSGVNRTKLVFSRSEDGNWTAPGPIDDNGAAESSPQLAVLANGEVLCAWEKVNRILPDGVDMKGMASAMEVAVASYDKATGIWSTQVLTADSHMDRTPRIAGDNNRAMVVWVYNDGDDFLGEDPNALNTIRYSLWNGSAWSSPATAASGIGCMLKTALAYDGTQAVFVYSVDHDWNMATDTDQELYALVYDGTRWLAPRRLTDDEVLDANPQVVYDGTDPLLVWCRQGQVVSCRNLDPNDCRLVLEAGNSFGPKDFRMSLAPGGRISLVWTGISAQTQGIDIFAALYDPSLDLWSNPPTLTADSDKERALAVTFVGPDELALIYDKDRLRADEDGIPEAYQTDLCVLRHRLGRDLAISPEDISVSKPDPNNGDRVQITAIVHNLGDAPEVNVPVQFFYGEPGEEDELIADQTLPGPIPAAGQETASFTWTIPQADRVTQLCVVVFDTADPQTGQPDRNTINNLACVPVRVPDLTVESVSVEKTDYKMRRVVARIADLEPVSARDIKVTIRRDSPEGQELASMTIPTLGAQSVEEVSWDWDITSLSFDRHEVVLYVIVDPSQTVTEADENNNTGMALVHVSKAGDITDDGSIDGMDMFYLTRHWLDTSASPDWVPGCDVDHNGRIDAADLAILARNWRWEAAWHTE